MPRYVQAASVKANVGIKPMEIDVHGSGNRANQSPKQPNRRKKQSPPPVVRKSPDGSRIDSHPNKSHAPKAKSRSPSPLRKAPSVKSKTLSPNRESEGVKLTSLSPARAVSPTRPKQGWRQQQVKATLSPGRQEQQKRKEEPTKQQSKTSSSPTRQSVTRILSPTKSFLSELPDYSDRKKLSIPQFGAIDDNGNLMNVSVETVTNILNEVIGKNHDPFGEEEFEKSFEEEKPILLGIVRNRNNGVTHNFSGSPSDSFCPLDEKVNHKIKPFSVPELRKLRRRTKDDPTGQWHPPERLARGELSPSSDDVENGAPDSQSLHSLTPIDSERKIYEEVFGQPIEKGRYDPPTPVRVPRGCQGRITEDKIAEGFRQRKVLTVPKVVESQTNDPIPEKRSLRRPGTRGNDVKTYREKLGVRGEFQTALVGPTSSVSSSSSAKINAEAKRGSKPSSGCFVKFPVNARQIDTPPAVPEREARTQLHNEGSGALSSSAQSQIVIGDEDDGGEAAIDCTSPSPQRLGKEWSDERVSPKREFKESISPVRDQYRDTKETQHLQTLHIVDQADEESKSSVIPPRLRRRGNGSPVNYMERIGLVKRSSPNSLKTASVRQESVRRTKKVSVREESARGHIESPTVDNMKNLPDAIQRSPSRPGQVATTLATPIDEEKSVRTAGKIVDGNDRNPTNDKPNDHSVPQNIQISRGAIEKRIGKTNDKRNRDSDKDSAEPSSLTKYLPVVEGASRMQSTGSPQSRNPCQSPPMKLLSPFTKGLSLQGRFHSPRRKEADSLPLARAVSPMRTNGAPRSVVYSPEKIIAGRIMSVISPTKSASSPPAILSPTRMNAISPTGGHKGFVGVRLPKPGGGLKDYRFNRRNEDELKRRRPPLPEQKPQEPMHQTNSPDRRASPYRVGSIVTLGRDGSIERCLANAIPPASRNDDVATHHIAARLLAESYTSLLRKTVTQPLTSTSDMSSRPPNESTPLDSVDLRNSLVKKPNGTPISEEKRGEKIEKPPATQGMQERRPLTLNFVRRPNESRRTPIWSGSDDDKSKRSKMSSTFSKDLAYSEQESDRPPPKREFIRHEQSISKESNRPSKETERRVRNGKPVTVIKIDHNHFNNENADCDVSSIMNTSSNLNESGMMNNKDLNLNESGDGNDSLSGRNDSLDGNHPQDYCVFQPPNEDFDVDAELREQEAENIQNHGKLKVFFARMACGVFASFAMIEDVVTYPFKGNGDPPIQRRQQPPPRGYCRARSAPNDRRREAIKRTSSIFRNSIVEGVHCSPNNGSRHQGKGECREWDDSPARDLEKDKRNARIRSEAAVNRKRVSEYDVGRRLNNKLHGSPGSSSAKKHSFSPETRRQCSPYKMPSVEKVMGLTTNEEGSGISASVGISTKRNTTDVLLNRRDKFSTTTGYYVQANNGKSYDFENSKSQQIDKSMMENSRNYHTLVSDKYPHKDTRTLEPKIQTTALLGKSSSRLYRDRECEATARKMTGGYNNQFDLQHKLVHNLVVRTRPAKEDTTSSASRLESSSSSNWSNIDRMQITKEKGQIVINPTTSIKRRTNALMKSVSSPRISEMVKCGTAKDDSAMGCELLEKRDIRCKIDKENISSPCATPTKSPEKLTNSAGIRNPKAKTTPNPKVTGTLSGIKSIEAAFFSDYFQNCSYQPNQEKNQQRIQQMKRARRLKRVVPKIWENAVDSEDHLANVDARNLLRNSKNNKPTGLSPLKEFTDYREFQLQREQKKYQLREQLSGSLELWRFKPKTLIKSWVPHYAEILDHTGNAYWCFFNTLQLPANPVLVIPIKEVMMVKIVNDGSPESLEKLSIKVRKKSGMTEIILRCRSPGKGQLWVNAIKQLVKCER